MFVAETEFEQKVFNKNYNTIQFWAQQLFEEILEDNSPFFSLSSIIQKLTLKFAGFKLEEDKF